MPCARSAASSFPRREREFSDQTKFVRSATPWAVRSYTCWARQSFATERLSLVARHYTTGLLERGPCVNLRKNMQVSPNLPLGVYSQHSYFLLSMSRFHDDGRGAIRCFSQLWVQFPWLESQTLTNTASITIFSNSLKYVLHTGSRPCYGSVVVHRGCANI